MDANSPVTFVVFQGKKWFLRNISPDRVTASDFAYTVERYFLTGDNQVVYESTNAFFGVNGQSDNGFTIPADQTVDRLVLGQLPINQISN